ncbi:PA14 domain-containing protein [Streptomyces sp. DSM 3412]|uniref:PA14 domain-containing protein n=1 Tax=Streptomyces gottesmaniae TaxID=3075518 RepID=A0ABU2ZAK4_9ACTN|nr:PA14 domain-containing protein [Streptomyces sp. DSM 3412]MDT0573138.1 PA14 domain-containing protein [Streptomyces sp. DSM 3412]
MIPKTPVRRTAGATAVVLATAGGLLAATAAPASAAVTCTSPVFKRQFFANTTFSGTPKKTDCDSAIDQNWGTGAPATGLPSNNFGVRWTVTRDFGSGGPFTLSVSGLDGIRVHLDPGTTDARKINLWKNGSTTVSKTLNLTIPSGKHTLRVDYVNWTGSAKVKFTYTPRTSATVDTVKPLVPAGASVSYDSETGQAKLTWAKNKEMDLAGYKVYRRLKGASFGSTPLATTTSTSYTDTGLPKSGAAYYYEVRAYDKAGNRSAGTAGQLVTTVDRIPPTVRDLKVSGESSLDGVSLWWMSEGAETNRLLRAASPDGPFEEVKGPWGNSATDATAPYGETSYYKVAVSDAAGNTAYSSVVSIARPLAVPYLWKTENRPEDGGGVDLRWDVSPYAPSEFRVHREERRFDEATGTFDVVDSQVVPCAPKLADTAYGTKYSYTCTDTTVVPSPDDGFYVYWVTTVDALGRESAPSQTISHGYGDGTAPPLVTGFTATATEYGTVLDWDDSPVADLAEYNVFRLSTVDDGTGYTHVGTVKAGTSRLVDSANLQDGEHHTYFVDAVDTSGNSNYTSADKMVSTTVTELDLRPTVETPADWLVGVNARAADGAAAVDLTWELSSSYNGTDITGYRVYRWNPATAAYEPLTADPVTGTSYTDTTAAAGATHFYWVTALHADGTESAPGDAWVALAP